MELDGKDQEFVLDAIFPPETTQEDVCLYHIGQAVTARS